MEFPPAFIDARELPPTPFSTPWRISAPVFDSQGNEYRRGFFYTATNLAPGVTITNEFFLAKYSAVQDFEWALAGHGHELHLKFDKQDCLWVTVTSAPLETGSFDNLQLDSTTGMSLIAQIAANDGSILKSRFFPSATRFLDTDSDGNIYIDDGTQIRKLTSSFDELWSYAHAGYLPTPLITSDGSVFLTPFPNSPESRLIALSPEGEPLWEKPCYPGIVQAGPSGAIYVAGAALSAALPEQILKNLGLSHERDIFLSRWSREGDFVWAQQLATMGSDTLTGFEIDANEHIHLAGSSFAHNGRLFASGSVFPLESGASFVARAGVIAKYTGDGDLLWLKPIDGPSIMACHEIFLDPGQNLHAIIGFNEGTVLALLARSIRSSPPLFTLHPADTAVPTGTETRLVAALAETNGVSLQWFQNGLPLSGQNALDLTIFPVSDAQYHCVASNSFGVTTSHTNRVLVASTGKVPDVLWKQTVGYSRNVDVSSSGEVLWQGSTISEEWPLDNFGEDRSFVFARSGTQVFSTNSLSVQFPTGEFITSRLVGPNSTVLLQKFTSSGDFLWETRVDGGRIVPATDGGVYLVSIASGSGSFFGELYDLSFGETAFLLARIGGDGHLLWKRIDVIPVTWESFTAVADPLTLVLRFQSATEYQNQSFAPGQHLLQFTEEGSLLRTRPAPPGQFAPATPEMLYFLGDTATLLNSDLEILWSRSTTDFGLPGYFHHKPGPNGTLALFSGEGSDNSILRITVISRHGRILGSYIFPHQVWNLTFDPADNLYFTTAAQPPPEGMPITGFEVLYKIENPHPPIELVKSPDEVSISWSSLAESFQLHRSSDLLQWFPVPASVESPTVFNVSLPPSDPQGFFNLRKPAH